MSSGVNPLNPTVSDGGGAANETSSVPAWAPAACTVTDEVATGNVRLTRYWVPLLPATGVTVNVPVTRFPWVLSLIALMSAAVNAVGLTNVTSSCPVDCCQTTAETAVGRLTWNVSVGRFGYGSTPAW